MSAKDYCGMSIYPGDRVVYPVRKGSSMWLEEARVLATYNNALMVEKKSGRAFTVKRTDRVVIVEPVGH